MHDHGGLFGSSTSSTLRIKANRILTHNGRTAHVFVWTCAGGETRGQLSITLRLLGTEVVSARPWLQLYEGASCNNDDLDDEELSPSRTVPRNVSRGFNLSVTNNEFGSYYDYATAAFDVTHWEGAGP
ncbi:hypothetical protein ACTMTF_48525 [Nonomuraea sp. ZG12]|uniref:hypothetical protein n=1 Tax=Nonomuraea sp. ZG12 TaxID=3452207 RepID=UPI003F8BA5CD